LRARGQHPGILTRGYGGQARDWPREVFPDSSPAELGDEPVLLARRAGCPVVAGPDRVADGLRLVQGLGCDILVSDDGLQHYRLRRDLEIAAVDARRGLGNRRCLPAGPLREPPGRLSEVSLVVLTGSGGHTRFSVPGHCLDLVPGDAVNLADPGLRQPLGAWRGRPLTAVAGIGNPGRFFGLLREAGLAPLERAYPDHHPFRAEDIASWGEETVLMTEKDSVKCAGMARPNHWYLPVEARPEPAFVNALEQRLEGLIRGQEIAGHPGLPPV
jgi:tetraacyldisaccharide 4'-kinase